MQEFSPKRARWFGAKRLANALLGWPPINAPVRNLLRWWSGGRKYFKFPVGVPEVVGFAGESTFVMLEPMRCNVAKELFWGNGRRIKRDERFAVDLFCQLARSADLVLDVGANTGLFAVAAAMTRPSARVEAFEIVPEIFALLEKNIARNGLERRVTPHCVALGRVAGKIVMPVLGAGDVLPLSISTRVQVEQGVEVPVEPLDAIGCDLPAERRVLVKVDVEGTEADVFEGGRDFFARHRPDVVCEVLPGSDYPKVQEFVGRIGYRALLIGDASLDQRDEIVPSRRHHDWLFTTRPADELSRLCAAAN